ncbi:A/G-specific adenine glycosylase [Candidatus Micrarchaeota archaeon]|nr:A/G-specific adenine glycosylase [Candidatus Micrarchaeota archaeon]
MLSWYARHKRNLPWRQTRDPYKIWVSEVLLQQTRVDQAIPYYRRFLQRFPTLEALAHADVNDVLKAWEGAGYYSRARNLHAAAKIAFQKYGRVPDSYEELLDLPGIGDYIASAVSSIAFNKPHAVLDGNVVRVLSRVTAEKGDVALSKTKEKLKRVAQENLPPSRAGTYNQALMELGATACLPKKPLCLNCPLRNDCRALKLKKQDFFPVKKKKKPVSHFTIACAVVRKNGRVLICQRKPQGLLGGLWEFPGGKIQAGESLPRAAAREVFEETGVKIRIGKKVAEVKHAYSHFKITLHAFDARWVSGIASPQQCQAVKWVRRGELEKYAFPKANACVIQALLTDSSSTRL